MRKMWVWDSVFLLWLLQSTQIKWLEARPSSWKERVSCWVVCKPSPKYSTFSVSSRLLGCSFGMQIEMLAAALSCTDFPMEESKRGRRKWRDDIWSHSLAQSQCSGGNLLLFNHLLCQSLHECLAKVDYINERCGEMLFLEGTIRLDSTSIDDVAKRMEQKKRTQKAITW